MIPILYEASETGFISNGICRLRDCISCIVTEERNGLYECDFEYPITGANYDKIKLGRIIAVEHDDTNDTQPFDIVSYTKPINGVVTFHAVHISYRLSKVTVTGSNINSLSDALTLLGTGTPANAFTYDTDKTGSGYMSAADGTPRSVRQLLGGIEGSILDTYGGEYEWDKFAVRLLANRGELVPMVVRYGINMTAYQEEADASDTYTSVIPYWKGEGATVVGNSVSTGGTSVGGRDECIPLDLTSKFESQPTPAEVESMALSMIQGQKPYIPSRSISVEFVRLSDSPEYAYIAPLQKCKLCDSIKVEFPAYRMEETYKIVKTVYNVLAERYESLELGKVQTTLTEALGISNIDGSATGNVGGGSVDYITEQNSSGDWNYRKWNSGKVEAWYNGSVAFGGTTAAGSLYYADASVTIPSGIFSSAPEVIASVRSTTGDALNGAVVSVTGLATSGTALTLRDFRVSSATTQHSAKIRLYAWTN